MAFEGLQDRLKEQWADLAAKVQETSLFNNLREKYESQTPTVQKAIIGGAAALAVMFVLSFPLGYLSSSGEHMDAFKENRSLIQGLLRASRLSKEASPLPPPMDPGSLRGMVERVLREKKLVPEQMGEMQAIPGEIFKGIPAGVIASGIAVQVKQLNLNQILDIGNTFQNLGPGTKLIGLDIVQTTGQDHYYDIILRVGNFGLPIVAEIAPPEPKGRPKGKKAADTEEE